MIERKFVDQKLQEKLISEFITSQLDKVGHSATKIQRTPLGEKIILSVARPGLVVGRGGANIKRLTKLLKQKFKLENPQIEISEVGSMYSDPMIVAESIASSLERFGLGKFKAVGHRMMTEVMNAGALGVEILISGKIPSARAKRWRFYSGYLKKCGDVALTSVRVAYATAQLKAGVVGIQVRIMPGDTVLPDHVSFRDLTAAAEPGSAAGSQDSISKSGEEVSSAKASEDAQSKKKPRKRRAPKKAEKAAEVVEVATVSSGDSALPGASAVSDGRGA